MSSALSSCECVIALLLLLLLLLILLLIVLLLLRYSFDNSVINVIQVLRICLVYGTKIGRITDWPDIYNYI